MFEESSLLNQLKHGCGELRIDATEMLLARVELAQLEWRLVRHRLARAATAVGICGLGALTGYVFLVHLAVEKLPPFIGLTKAESLASAGSGLIVAGGLGAWLIVRRFCRKSRHFELTMAELRMDVHALQVWLDRKQTGE